MVKELEKLPEKIKEDIEEEFEKHEKEILARPYNQLYVTELCYCLRKAFLYRKLGPRKSLNDAWHFFKGYLLHDRWSKLFEDDNRSTHRVKDSGIVISGKYDWTFPEFETIWELKTIKSLYYIMKEKKPKKEHVRQILFYTYTNSFKRGKILYTDWSELKIFDINPTLQEELENIQYLEERAKKLYHALKDDTPPEPEGWDWECGVCQYKKECGSPTYKKS